MAKHEYAERIIESAKRDIKHNRAITNRDISLELEEALLECLKMQKREYCLGSDGVSVIGRIEAMLQNQHGYISLRNSKQCQPLIYELNLAT